MVARCRGERPWAPGAALLHFRSRKGNAMSNKPHLRPHKQLQRQSGWNRMTAVLMALLFIVLIIVAVAMVSSGHGVPPGVR
jgi:hypothetical protein